MTAPPIPAQRRPLFECEVCGTPVANLLTPTCGKALCVALSNRLDDLESRDDD
jgi:hypothetical protein